MIKDSMKLAGYLVAYGIKHKDGTTETHELEVPIHNTITKHMLNSLLEFNGPNEQTQISPDTRSYLLWTLPYSQTSVGNYHRSGSINYGAFGSGTGATSVADTDLKNRTSNIVMTRPAATDLDPYTSYICTSDTIKMRQSYLFQTVSENTTVNEVGTFHRIEPNGEFKMTARVQLDTPITLVAGDAFFFTYEIWVKFNVGPTLIEVPGIGTVRKTNTVKSSSVGRQSFGRFASFPTACKYSEEIMASTGHTKLPAYTTFTEGQYNGQAGLNHVIAITSDTITNNGLVFGNNLPSITTYYNYDDGVNITPKIKPYTEDSFYRDYELEFSTLWMPSGAIDQIWGLLINGDFYEFGSVVNDEFVKAPWTRPANSIIKITMRQSWSTDLLTPSA